MIELQWEWLGGLPPLRKAAVIGAGSWGTAVAVLLARGGLEVQLGCRTAEQAEEMNRESHQRALPARTSTCPTASPSSSASEIELAGMDLVCLGVPSKGLPAAVGSIGDRVGERSAVLMLSKGLVAPMGALPSEYVARAGAVARDRLPRRAGAREGGRLGDRGARAGQRRRRPARQLGEVFDEAGLVCERTDDVTGVEMAGVAKNAAAVAAAAAEPHGMNAAGIATAEVWRECLDYAELRGGRPETFSGLAGIGDLTATILAPGSRNRRAGELLGKGMPAGRDPRQSSARPPRGWTRVPLIAETVSKAGVDAPGLEGLARLIAGEISPAEWMAGLRRAERAGRRPREPAAPPSRGTLGAWPTARPTSGAQLTSPRAQAKAELDRDFEQLYRDHLRDVYSYSYYRVGNHHDAEDLTEQAFLQAYRHFERAQRESDGRPLRPWLIRIAHNLASNYHRDRARKPQSPLDNSDPIAAMHGTEQIVEGPGGAAGPSWTASNTFPTTAARH